ncbi:protein maternal effect lethal 26 [Trichonephila clavata]|uniref:Protein maternal effect lethal 26 n=1 Tax=Trichonephila clavata TaxID=2740835 RepID=A0A8X6H0R0_TRICU|nr:protein maternal effect lethal 26 [Trichonephila clavata]
MSEMIPNNDEVNTREEDRERNFKWIVENVCKFSKRLFSSEIFSETACKPEFRLVARLNEMFSEEHVTNVSIGLQRIDSGEATIHVAFDIELLNLNGDIYCQKTSSFLCSPGGAPYYIFSELFSDSPQKLTLPNVATGISSNDKHELIGLKGKRLVASRGKVGNIFILPNGVLVVEGHVKTVVCGVYEKRLTLEEIREKRRQKNHADRLLMDIAGVYKTGIMTDVELLVDGRIIKAHKFILQSRSPVFRKMFEHNTTEKDAGSIEVTDVAFIPLQALVWYLYTGEVQRLPFEDVCDLYETADKYEVFMLQQACSESLLSFIDQDTVCRILVLSDLHNDIILRQHATMYTLCNFLEVREKADWELTVRTHQRIASDILEKVCRFSGKLFSIK